jgi:hypothetical protein
MDIPSVAGDPYYQVRIEFIRVQTYLFSAPRLRLMVGANVLLGEIIRQRLMKKFTGQEINIDFLPGIAVDPLDPLQQAPEEQDRDDPYRLYRQGVLCRDGGHFGVLFSGKDGEKNAEEFKKKAEKLLLVELPGLRFEISEPQLFIPKSDETDKELKNPIAKPLQPQELPIFEICRETGRGPANTFEEKDGSKVFITDAVSQRKKKGDQFFRKKNTRDIIGLLQKQLPLSHLDPPEDFQDLCGDEYMALVHADGNQVGYRFTEWKKTWKNEDNSLSGWQQALAREAHGEQFYYTMRVAVRRAVLAALKVAFSGFKGSRRPYQLLMLGGDDLLMVCRARHVMDFLIHYADQLSHINLCQDKLKSLGIGAGVVIAAPNLPFHRLHVLAEDLASSAKQLYRCLNPRKSPDEASIDVSVADWMVVTQSWADDVRSQRRRDGQVSYQVSGVDNLSYQETLVLSNKPYRILADRQSGPYDLSSLQGLWQAAKFLKQQVAEQRAARSQLRDLADALREGRHAALLEFRELAPATRQVFKILDITEPFTRFANTKKPPGDGHELEKQQWLWTTHLADLIELYEIHQLARRPDRQGVSR